MTDPRASQSAILSLCDVQGFVTSGYGHLPFSAYSFITIQSRGGGRRLLNRLAPMVTTAAPWRSAGASAKNKPPRTLNIAVTFEGLAALGLPEEGLASLPDDFREGMARSAESLGDIGLDSSDRWEIGNPRKAATHIMLLFH